MNPLIYKNFKIDMLNAVEDFINTTNYSVENLNESSIVLTNNILFINFYLDGASMVCSVNSINGIEKSLYEIFTKNDISSKYTFDVEGEFSYEEWNKYKVKKILEIIKYKLKESFSL